MRSDVTKLIAIRLRVTSLVILDHCPQNYVILFIWGRVPYRTARILTKRCDYNAIYIHILFLLTKILYIYIYSVVVTFHVPLVVKKKFFLS